jgi:hypothetical protein
MMFSVSASKVLVVALALGAVIVALPNQAFGAPITLTAFGDTILQDNDNNGTADVLFGLGGFPAGPIGALTQANKPSQGSIFVTDRDAIRFNLNPLAGASVVSATLRLVQISDVRGLQAGSERVYGFLDDATPEVDDYSGGTLLGTISAPGIVGAVVTIDVTAFLQSALSSVGPGNDFAVFRLQDPVTTDLTGNPYSLSFSNDRTGGVPIQLIVETAAPAAAPAPSTVALLVLALSAGFMVRTRARVVRS